MMLLYYCYLCMETQHYCLLTGGAVKIKYGPLWFWGPAQNYPYCYSDNSDAISVIIFLISQCSTLTFLAVSQQGPQPLFSCLYLKFSQPSGPIVMYMVPTQVLQSLITLKSYICVSICKALQSLIFGVFPPRRSYKVLFLLEK